MEFQSRKLTILEDLAIDTIWVENYPLVFVSTRFAVYLFLAISPDKLTPCREKKIN